MKTLVAFLVLLGLFQASWCDEEAADSDAEGKSLMFPYGRPHLESCPEIKDRKCSSKAKGGKCDVYDDCSFVPTVGYPINHQPFQQNSKYGYGYPSQQYGYGYRHQMPRYIVPSYYNPYQTRSFRASMCREPGKMCNCYGKSCNCKRSWQKVCTQQYQSRYGLFKVYGNHMDQYLPNQHGVVRSGEENGNDETEQTATDDGNNATPNSLPFRMPPFGHNNNDYLLNSFTYNLPFHMQFPLNNKNHGQYPFRPYGPQFPIPQYPPHTGGKFPIPQYPPHTGGKFPIPQYPPHTGGKFPIPPYPPHTGGKFPIPQYPPHTGGKYPMPYYPTQQYPQREMWLKVMVPSGCKCEKKDE